MRIILSYSLIAILTIGVNAQTRDMIVKGGTVYDGSSNAPVVTDISECGNCCKMIARDDNP